MSIKGIELMEQYKKQFKEAINNKNVQDILELENNFKK
jgi:ABC-type transporter MlaC component